LSKRNTVRLRQKEKSIVERNLGSTLYESVGDKRLLKGIWTHRGTTLTL
jgi:hypothetical protein